MLVELVHDRGFPDAGITGHQYQLRRAMRCYVFESLEQAADLKVPPVYLLRDQKLIRNIVNSDRERRDLFPGFQGRETLPQVFLYADSGLITLLRYFGEEPHDYG